LGEGEELEVVGVLDRVANELGVGCREGVVEARERGALAATEVGRDLGLEDASGPAVFDGLRCIPEPDLGVLELGEQGDVVSLMPMLA
jgi:hypothetical protein